MDTSVWRITRTSSAAFLTALVAVLFFLAVIGAFLVVAIGDDGPWLTPEGRERPLGEVLLFVFQLAMMPLLMAAPVWLFIVWRWKSILKDCYEVKGRILSIRKPKPDMWVLHFTHSDTAPDGKVVVRPTPWARRLIEKRKTTILVSNRSPRHGLPRDLFLVDKPRRS